MHDVLILLLGRGRDAYTVIGGIKGVAKKEEKHSSINILGCPCYLLHTVALIAALQLPVNLENLWFSYFTILRKILKDKIL